MSEYIAECGCRYEEHAEWLDVNRRPGGSIPPTMKQTVTYCPIHAAAGDMLAMLMRLNDAIQSEGWIAPNLANLIHAAQPILPTVAEVRGIYKGES